MKTILAGVLLGLFVSPLSAQTFGLGPETPIEVAAVVTTDTFGLQEPLAANFPASAPMYETVSIVTGYRTVCFGDHCEQVPITSTVRRLVVDKAPEAPPGIVVGSPQPGNHQHTDPVTNQVWEHGNENVGNDAAHVSPFTGTYVTNRSAESFPSYGQARNFIRLRAIRGRFGFRR